MYHKAFESVLCLPREISSSNVVFSALPLPLLQNQEGWKKCCRVDRMRGMVSFWPGYCFGSQYLGILGSHSPLDHIENLIFLIPNIGGIIQFMIYFIGRIWNRFLKIVFFKKGLGLENHEDILLNLTYKHKMQIRTGPLGDETSDSFLPLCYYSQNENLFSALI